MRYILCEQDRWPREQITTKSGFPALRPPSWLLRFVVSSLRRFVRGIRNNTVMVGQPGRQKGPNQQVDLRVQSWNAGLTGLSGREHGSPSYFGLTNQR